MTELLGSLMVKDCELVLCTENSAFPSGKGFRIAISSYLGILKGLNTIQVGLEV